MKMRISSPPFLLFAIILFAAVIFADEKAGEEINWQVISGGGALNGVSANFRLSGTVAQTATGSGSSTNYGVSHGFWQDFGDDSPNCCAMMVNSEEMTAVETV